MVLLPCNAFATTQRFYYEWHECSSGNLVHIFRTLFHKNTLESVTDTLCIRTEILPLLGFSKVSGTQASHWCLENFCYIGKSFASVISWWQNKHHQQTSLKNFGSNAIDIAVFSWGFIYISAVIEEAGFPIAKLSVCR